MGDLSQAEAHARAAMAFAPGDVTAVLVNTLIERGDVAAAADVLDIRPVDAGDDHLLLQPVIAARGRLRIMHGEDQLGISDLQAVGEWLDRWPVLNPAVVPWRSMLAQSLARLGDAQHAQELAAEELKTARGLGQAPALGIALRGVALLEGQDDSIPLLHEAVRVLEGSAARLEHAWALMHLGAALRRAGHRREARDPLREALDTAHRCGADLLARQARTELLATGARPRRHVIHGRDALTATERRIAELAATGQTTREIAHDLFVTTKTVETHLGHIYRKLDIHSRSQLAAALGPRE
jgi:DNA-binding CsgD family transcriptional regulator